MPRPKRARTKITISTGEDASLWRYSSITEALTQNVDILARLVQWEPSSSDEEPMQGAAEHGYMKDNRQLEQA
jgi:hypothetical protein